LKKTKEGIFYRRYFENLKNKSPKKVEVLSWFRQISKPFSCGSPNKSKEYKIFLLPLPVLLPFNAKSFLGCYPMVLHEEIF
jgi:hypothetical protein